MALRLHRSLRTRGSSLLLATRCGARPTVFRTTRFLATLTGTGRGDVGAGEQAIDATKFHAEADRILTCLFDTIDESNLDCIDEIMYEDGVLKVDILDKGSFVINKHFVTQQIWYASPVSGALYFSYRSDGTWFSEGAGSDLVQVLSSDLAKECPESKPPALDLDCCRTAE
mmetsp:Transcript_84553/g.149634  ORF Transcript_84553/g.149634 Transcript_84553/m.149634 type:complete len:171 (-) Transcript_84553:89-601(-)